MSSRRADWLTGAAVAVVTIAGVAVVMRLWRADLGVPFLYGGDSNLFLMFIKGILEHGWLLNNPDLGAPFGQQLYDFPVSSGDTLHLLEIKFLGLFSSNPAVVVNLFYLIGFPLTGISAFAVFRALAIARAPAAVCAVLFAVLPYHFIENVAQPFHGSYWVIPPACYLVLSILADRPLFTRAARPRNRLLAFASRRTLLTLLLCALIGSAGSNYYALYAALLAAVVTPFALLRSRHLRTLLAGALVSAAIAGTVFVNALPTTIYHAQHGSNPEDVGKRIPAESETYSLSVASLVLPVPGHRLAPLAHLRERYYADSPVPAVATGPGLGAVGTIGFLWLIGFALASCVGAVRRSPGWSLHGDAALGTLASLLIATTGGFSIIFALLVSPQLRVWERFYLFIAFFSLLAAALLLERAVRRIGVAGRRRYLAAAVLGGVLVLGGLDQTSNDSTFFVPPYKTTAAEYHQDADFVAAIERRLPAGATIFELPYVPFPDGAAVGGTYPFDQGRGYIHSSDLRWSYGAMQGRPANWQEPLIDKPLDLLVPAVTAAGFDGIWVDRFAYPANARALEAGLRAQLGVRPLVSENQRFSFWDLRPYRRSLRRSAAAARLPALRDATLHPVYGSPGDGLVRTSLNGGGFTPGYALTAQQGTLDLINPESSSRAVDLLIRAATPAAAHGRVSVRLPDGRGALLGANHPLQLRLRLPPGSTPVTLSAAPPGAATPALAVELVDLRMLPFSSRGPAARVFPQPAAGGASPSSPSAPGQPAGAPGY